MNEDKLQLAERGHDESRHPLNRREFLQSVGGGIAIFFTVGEAATQAGRGAGKERPDFNAYLRIGQDGKVKCFTGKVELGQGVITSLAQSLADELDVPIESVEMVMSDTAQCPYDAGTWGSTTTPRFGPILRAAGAEARAVLIGLAAVRLKVPKDRLDVKDGVVFDRTAPNTKVSYADLAEGKSIARQLDLQVQVKNPSEMKIINKPHNRIDAVAKVTGKAQYTGDIRLDGMVCAKVLRPPAHGATLKSLDTSAVDSMEDFQVVRDDDLVAVLHKHPDMAEKALSKLKAEYDIPEARFDDKTVFDHLVDHAAEGKVTKKGGDVDAGHKLAQVVVEEKYLDGYVAHAAIETHSAVAQFEGDNLTVWASTQTPFGLQRQIVNDFKMPIENVRVIAPFVGGGFGGKISNGQAIQAVRLAKIAKKPVQLVWSRADEFFYDTFRPAAVVKIKSGISSEGKIVSWDYNIYGMGSRGADLFYDVPHHRTTVCQNLQGGEKMHVLGTGAWRAPDNNSNSFARESHIDVMATKAGIDPLEFRLKNLADEQMKAVLKAAADKFGYTPAKTPSGRGIGVACGMDVGVPVALIAEVQVDKQTGSVQVKRVVCAQDLGLVINPEGATLQVEGCITMGLGYALTEDIHFKGGEVLDLSFGTYELPRFSWVPKIETVLIEASDQPSKGGGEPAIVAMGGLIANAIHDATGARVKQMPMTPERIKQAMA
ncbi:MAG TPA: molybdopterin cofactor-binding domain-containing protein [Sedimentisphaerales bacterium]|nr:molybdopterin cofactor-binding domain-containing protein [Sedimentisphaerales bacterium]